MGNQVWRCSYNQYRKKANYQMYQNPIMVNHNITNDVNIIFIKFLVYEY